MIIKMECIMKKCIKCLIEKEKIEFSKCNTIKDGHQSKCKQCDKIYRIKHKERIQEYLRIYSPVYKKVNKEKIRIYTKKQNVLNGKRNRERIKEHIKIYKKKYKEENRDIVRFDGAKRHAMKLQRTPKWLTKEQLLEIKQFYIDAFELQWLSDPTDPLQVDHIVPLQGKNVSGLHVPWNLQILTRSENCAKWNKFEINVL